MAHISFDDDIRPFFDQYRTQMLWRMDITSEDDVKANAALIKSRIDPKSESPMPPPPFPRFSQQFFDNFCTWMKQEGVQDKEC